MSPLANLQLARLILDPQHRGTYKLVRDLDLMHKVTALALPPEASPRDAHLLWRMDGVAQARPIVSVQCTGDWDPARYAQVEEALEVKGPIPMGEQWADKVTAGSLWAFRARLNPTWMENDTRRRRPLLEYDQQAEWLLRQSKGAFTYANDPVWGEVDLAIDNEGPLTSRTRGLTLGAVSYRGTLQVRDPELFQELIVRGVGRGKSFGMGLLQLQPRI
ncbi:type I-E CRISPR-associated protein Cas6/Cse3/CasE [uncultured Kocuria sp.]|uniref:type I-E CRISPR-associated protein Cas6/Cse3/CasE n=1 Tax=uncultured Kocuria sp. TaxID=259305 RepID=UPI002634B9D8|nr:type I-E CRISPR-associated protein Cas6/Cse3/CasE [uncultured Kocuria sp.]